jgi:hypothetical protein
MKVTWVKHINRQIQQQSNSPWLEFILLSICKFEDKK